MIKKAVVVLGIVVAVLALLSVAAVVLAEPLGWAQDPPEGSVAAPEWEPISWSSTVPKKMNYQGILRDDAGNPIDGTHDLTFSIYTRGFIPFPWPGRWKWSEVYSETQTIQVDNGLFNVVIGAVNDLDPGDFGGLWGLGGRKQLRVSVDGGTALSPYLELVTVPYAFRAEYVDRFPRQHYTSGWKVYNSGSGGSNKLTHGLGGDVDNYIVELLCRGTGMDTSIYQCDDDIHTRWWGLGDASIWVTNYAGNREYRVRIWRID